MAHKTLIGGTAYGITGGRALINGTGYSILNGKTLIDGTAYEIGFGGGDKWPDDLDTGLEFVSASAFTISAEAGINGLGWDGTMEYCNSSEGWKTWDGSEIPSGGTDKGQCIYVRGTGNTMVSFDRHNTRKWSLNGNSIECNGNIEKLLDYSTVKAGEHPQMGTHCFQSMFDDCLALIAAPSLPATTLTDYCYSQMFWGCTNLTTPPSLPATTLKVECYNKMFCDCTNLIAIPRLPATALAFYCYFAMFSGCTKIKLSETMTGTYTKAYRIPYSGTGSNNMSMSNMFNNTGGTFAGTPSINTTYYLDESNTIV